MRGPWGTYVQKTLGRRREHSGKLGEHSGNTRAKTFRGDLGNTQGTFGQTFFGEIWGTFDGEDSGNIRKTFGDDIRGKHSGKAFGEDTWGRNLGNIWVKNLRGTFGEYSGKNLRGTFGEHSGKKKKPSGRLGEHSGNIPPKKPSGNFWNIRAGNIRAKNLRETWGTMSFGE